MLEEYRTRGRISRPVSGLTVVRIQGDLAEELGLPTSGGLLVQGVDPGSAAADAGIRGPRQTVIAGNYQLGVGGDLITAIDGKVVDANDSLEKAMAHKRGGDKISFVVYRGGKPQTVTITLGEAPETL